MLVVILCTLKVSTLLNKLAWWRDRILCLQFLGCPNGIKLLTHLAHFAKLVCLRGAVVVLTGATFNDLLEVNLIFLGRVV